MRQKYKISKMSSLICWVAIVKTTRQTRKRQRSKEERERACTWRKQRQFGKDGKVRQGLDTLGNGTQVEQMASIDRCDPGNTECGMDSHGPRGLRDGRGPGTQVEQMASLDRFEPGNTEGGMDSHGPRELQANSGRADNLRNGIGPINLGANL